MKKKKFEAFLTEYTNEIGKFVPLTKPLDSVILVTHLVERDVTENLINLLQEGCHFSTKHLATKQDLEEIGIENISSDYFLFDKPTAFTIPVLVPQKS